MSGTRYIMSMGELSRKDNSICFRKDNRNVYLPIENIKEIFCLNEISMNTKFLDFISKAGITIHFFNYHQQYSGTFYPKEQLISGRLKVRQAETYLNKRVVIAKAIVQGIGDNIYECLYHYYKHGKSEVKETLDWIRLEMPRLLNVAQNVNQVMAVEGETWQRFYSCFQYILPESFVFNKRVKRPPDNPLNAMISFGNTILYAKTVTQIYNTHLDQSISFLHEPSEGRFSLSLDLSEAFKPIIVYKTIFELVNNRRIQVSKHFESNLNYCLLNESGKNIFVGALEERFEKVFEHPKLKRKVSYRTAMKLDGYKLIKFIMEGKEFRPFSAKELY